MTFVNYCQIFEFLLLLLTMVKLIINKNKLNKKSIDIILFVALLLIDAIIRFIWTQNKFIFNFVHVCIPIMFCCWIWLSQIISIPIVILIQLIFTFCGFYFLNNIMIIITFCLSLILIIHKAVSLAKQSSRKLKVAPIYFIIAFDQILTFIIYILNRTPYNWHMSSYIHPFNIFVNLFFPFTIFYINVKFRRLIFI
jgi:hypothetical protein